MENTQPSTNDLTVEEKSALTARAEYLATLLESSVMSEQMKAAWITLLPAMNLQQVDRLIGFLEEEVDTLVEYEKKFPEDIQLTNDLNKAKTEYDQEVTKINNTAVEGIESLGTTIQK